MIGNVMIDARSTGKYYHCEYKNLRCSFICISIKNLRLCLVAHIDAKCIFFSMDIACCLYPIIYTASVGLLLLASWNALLFKHFTPQNYCYNLF